MTATDPGDRFPATELNIHDIMSPFMFSPGTSREHWDDRSEYYEERDRFMSVNPEMVAVCTVIADELLGMQRGEADEFHDEIELPDAVSMHGAANRIMFFNSESPYFGIRLTLDNQVKLATNYGYFVHPVERLYYESPGGGAGARPGERPYSDGYLLGLVDRTDPRGEDEFDPQYAIAISNDCRYARIVQRRSDEEITLRREALAVARLGSQARAEGEQALRSHMAQLRVSTRAEVRAGMMDSRLSQVADLALLAMLGEDEVIALTATDEETDMFGIGPGGNEELMVAESVDDIPLERLLAAQALLSRPEAYDSPVNS